MIAAVFHFESQDIDAWSGRDIDLDVWRYNTKMFGLDTLIIIDQVPGGTPYLHLDEEQKFERFTSIDEFLHAYPQGEKIWFETPWSFPSSVTPIKLVDFKHPSNSKDVFYIFGPGNGFTISENDTRTWVTIPQLTLGATHSSFLAPIVFYDRAQKLGII
ncbi:hypothetical protein A3H85_00200 [Candidatus Daviesbacteria bacterium RIFCSPLOWO2_02_FULL_40_8]|uniref:Uncharacterized protein n=1 Tax=Candidatus Daviesbacteria bacterium RIFCSPLOWO2_01_FULL_40_24 TaxID=1797787 RepID=A0A1F5MJN5_9BACT|nr:MAG: hypothetical protein A2780_01280 [Candidatus Daviesbacteria bacterium RIFCSPHIGHO2_01_FULL_41_45]OGE35506.1 MAG: hypothetical protein A3C32_03600 [Candidatus Daviesbacteria bacterium RIFCSPHIGHO2_02_FULL_41_14]OGE65597.1 MAG: hypothetical protein A3B49_02175 [Candidatus Daviesbacteria bacterium RIFCSPLOWO2_01_FULL_40_24]OGE66528.1 MAG: hypothetical protein A3H85_00200 [Candidatus Daviesbacteria bacterium RIFCSPLOWO2_02_FULL_40_8]